MRRRRTQTGRGGCVRRSSGADWERGAFGGREGERKKSERTSGCGNRMYWDEVRGSELGRGGDGQLEQRTKTGPKRLSALAR